MIFVEIIFQGKVWMVKLDRWKIKAENRSNAIITHCTVWWSWNEMEKLSVDEAFSASILIFYMRYRVVIQMSFYTEQRWWSCKSFEHVIKCRECSDAKMYLVWSEFVFNVRDVALQLLMISRTLNNFTFGLQLKAFWTYSQILRMHAFIVLNAMHKAELFILY